MRQIIKLVIAAALALSLGACGFNLFQSVENPVSDNDLYGAEIVFDGAVKTFNQLKDLCGKRALPPACRTYVLQGQSLIRNASAADKSARVFIHDNPTLDATNVIHAFTGLVSNFKTNVADLSNVK